MEKDDNNIKIKNTKYTLEQSPHYEEQKEEIELLNNIIPDRLTIESDNPNYILNIIVKSSLENPEKEYRLKIYLNYFYPEKSPRFDFYEINDFLQEHRKEEAISRFKKVLEENLGFTTIYQLYESAIEFADEEEERRAKIIEEYKHQIGKVHFPLNQMKSYKQFDSINVTDVIILKNNYLLLASCEDKYAPYLRIIDECYEKELYELNLLSESKEKYQFEIQRLLLYNISNTEEELYVVCSDKNIRTFRIKYLKSVSKKTGLNLIIENTTKSFSYKQCFRDLLILSEYNNTFLFLCIDTLIFWKYNENLEINDKYIINEISTQHKEIFYLDKNLFALTNSKDNSLAFLHVDDSLMKIKWGKTVKVACSKKNYVLKIDEKNVLFGNRTLKELHVIYIPTGEIVTKYEYFGLTSMHRIDDLIYLCNIKGIEEVNFKKIIYSEEETNYKPWVNNVTLIKLLGKGYMGFSTASKFFVCK
jgi:hypothetical protein